MTKRAESCACAQHLLLQAGDSAAIGDHLVQVHRGADHLHFRHAKLRTLPRRGTHIDLAMLALSNTVAFMWCLRDI